VVAGWRPHKQPGPDGEPVVGSLLLGLYDTEGRLHHIGVAASFSVAKRAELTALLADYEPTDGEEHPWGRWAGDARQPGMQSRWSAGKDLSFRPVRPELVAEVAYDHMEGQRFRHVAKLVRFRPDRDPQSCTFEQLDRPLSYELGEVVTGLG
jgi:ATP-dependent DNA ligase